MKIKNILKNKNFIYWSIFILYSIINLILVFHHEPWRDEIHTWLLAKNLSIPELFIESKFDGHPILWHLILLPFAKLNFPIITLNLISYIIILVSAWLFLFKTNIPLGIKLFALFTIPFTYIYSAISRNYSVMILLLVIIGIFYNTRFKKPIIYSILICLLIHTHSLSWGIVAGLTITFHIYEIYLWLRKKNTANIIHILIGLFLIAFNTVLVIFQLFGTSNTDYFSGISTYVIEVLLKISIIIIFLFIYTIFILKSNYKEFFIILFGLGFQAFIYTFVYSSILFQRYMLFFVLLLFYLIIISHDKKNITKLKFFFINFSYIIIVGVFGLYMFFSNVTKDYIYPYSNAKEIASYINNNLPESSTILIDASIIGQSIVPYLGNNNKLYDIAYDEYVTSAASVSHDLSKINSALSNLSKYSGNYIIICNDFVVLDNYELVYKTEKPLINEAFSLYYINF